MAQPQVFISSTYYDLKYVRSSLELFVESLGFAPVLSEAGGVAYAPDRPLDESCYREVHNCDIYVLIIGGRYGSEGSATRSSAPREFFEQYESVTKLEYKVAVDNSIPIYVLIERSVYAEYQTYLKNRESTDIRYAHVDSVNVYRFIEDILAQPRNNPVQPFDKYAEIESWLRLQWAGLFRELMLRMSTQQQLASLAAQVTELTQVSATLRRYMEEIVSSVAKKGGQKIIQEEHHRLAEAAIVDKLRANGFVRFVHRRGVPIFAIREGLEKAETLDDVPQRTLEAWQRVETDVNLLTIASIPLPFAKSESPVFRDVNDARVLLGKTPFPADDPTETAPVAGAG